MCVKAEIYSIRVTQQSENLNNKVFWTESELDQPEIMNIMKSNMLKWCWPWEWNVQSALMNNDTGLRDTRSAS